MTTSPIPKRTALAPPALVLGAMNFGKRTPAVESERIVRRALDRGIRAFDTANAYNAGESERVLGRALGTDRQRVVLATKVGMDRVGGKPEGLARSAIVRAMEGSLQRLGTDYVDVYYLHVPDHVTPIEETLDGMHQVLRSGAARAWGVSNYAAWQILEMNGLADARGMPHPAVSQVLYNALHRELEIEYFAFARRFPIHTAVYNPLAGGLLTGKHRYEESPEKGSRFDGNAMYQKRYWTQAMFERVEQLREVAQAEGRSMVSLAYAWAASNPGVDSILVGPASVEQLDDAADAVERALSPDARARIDELARTWSGTDTSYVR